MEEFKMKGRECDYRARQKYAREKTKQIGLAMYINTDADLIVWLDSQENKQGYIKALIRADMEAQGFKMPDAQENEI